MRELKFRYWSETHQEMIVVSLQELGNRELAQKAVHSSKEAVELSPPMQYTGLKDKNGTEIYDGDIIRQPLPDLDVYNWIVHWGEDVDTGGHGWLAKAPELGKSYWLDASICESSEVIGNIYENKDLLK